MKRIMNVLKRWFTGEYCLDCGTELADFHGSGYLYCPKCEEMQ